MIEQEDLLDDEAVIVLDVVIEFYLKKREEPLQVLTAFKVTKSAILEGDDPLEVFMDLLQWSILAVVDTVGEHRYVFEDTRKNKRVILTKEVQSISILAPDRETIEAAIELAE